MDNGSESAEMIVRLVLQGTIFVMKISGQATASVLSFLAAATAQKTRASGRTDLKKLLMTGSELKVFTVQGRDNFDEFVHEAKRYGMLFSVVKRTKEDKETGIYDIMVRTEDASKLNRIIERHHMAEVSATTKPASPEEVRKKEIVDARQLLAKMLELDNDQNPWAALGGPSRSNALYRVPFQTSRRSVRKEMDDYSKKRGRAPIPETAGDIMPNLMSPGENLQNENEQLNKREMA